MLIVKLRHLVRVYLVRVRAVELTEIIVHHSIKILFLFLIRDKYLNRKFNYNSLSVQIYLLYLLNTKCLKYSIILTKIWAI